VVTEAITALAVTQQATFVCACVPGLPASLCRTVYADLFGMPTVPGTPSYNVAPTLAVAVVRQADDPHAVHWDLTVVKHVLPAVGRLMHGPTNTVRDISLADHRVIAFHFLESFAARTLVSPSSFAFAPRSVRCARTVQ
jgi:hypothetical protein